MHQIDGYPRQRIDRTTNAVGAPTGQTAAGEKRYELKFESNSCSFQVKHNSDFWFLHSFPLNSRIA